MLLTRASTMPRTMTKPSCPLSLLHLVIRVSLLLELHQAAQSRQLRCFEDLRHQGRDHQLRLNVLRRDDAASREVAQILVPHVDVLGLDLGGFTLDLNGGCQVVDVHQHRYNWLHSHLSKHMVQADEVARDLRHHDEIGFHRGGAHAALFLHGSRHRHHIGEHDASH